MRIAFLHVLYALTISFACVGSAHADGMVFEVHNVLDDHSASQPIPQYEQVAAIRMEGGNEHLLIAINIPSSRQDRAVWMFPVLGPVDKCRIDIADSFPVFSGIDPHLVARERLDEFLFKAYVGQGWPVILRTLWKSFAYPITLAEIGDGTLHGGHGGPRSEDVRVHQKLDQWGLHAELISAPSMVSLETHLHANGVEIDRRHLGTFSSYLNDTYALAIAWIESLEDIEKAFPHIDRPTRNISDRMPCLYVEYPSDNPYYPMLPTSGYGNAHIGVRIYCVGYAEMASAYLSSAEHNYQGRRSPDDHATRFWEGTSRREIGWYTLWNAVSDAHTFDTDVVLNIRNPPNTEFAWLTWTLEKEIGTTTTIIAVIIIASYVCSGLTGLIFFGSWHPYAFLGLGNLFSLLGYIAGWKLMAKRRVELQNDIFPVCFTILFTATIFALGAIIGWAIPSSKY